MQHEKKAQIEDELNRQVVGQTSLDDQIKCIRRELALRGKCYPRWVNDGRMTQLEADKEMQAMSAVLETLLRQRP